MTRFMIFSYFPRIYGVILWSHGLRLDLLFTELCSVRLALNVCPVNWLAHYLAPHLRCFLVGYLTYLQFMIIRHLSSLIARLFSHRVLK